MLKNFLLRKMLKSKLKDVPAQDQENLIAMIEKNPEFFKKIATEVQAEVSKGKDQMQATMAVMQRHQEELKKIM